ncbi:MAG: Ig-like domain-containing protein, partial [Planctomycetota bacterium]
GVQPSTVTLNNDGRTAVLVFETPLAIGDKLDVGIGGVTKDINGNAVPATNDLAIQPSMADIIHPEVTLAMWVPNYAAGGYQLTVKFNESMDQTSIDSITNWGIHGMSANITGVSLGNDGKTATLTVVSALSVSDLVEISINPTNPITDINGNKLFAVRNQVISANSADFTGPRIDPAVVPTWDVLSTPTYKATFKFDEAMDRASAENPANYVLTGHGTKGTQLLCPSTAQLEDDGQTVHLNFGMSAYNTGLTSNDRLELQILITDVNGRATTNIAPIAMSANGGDGTGPTLVETPMWGANQPNYTVLFKFNEVLNVGGAGNPLNYEMDGHGATGTQQNPVYPTRIEMTYLATEVKLIFDQSANGQGFTFDDKLTVTAGVDDINGQPNQDTGSSVIKPNPDDTTGPYLISSMWDVNQTRYRLFAQFNEVLDAPTAVVLTNYKLYGMGESPDTAVLDTLGTTVTLTFTSTAGFDTLADLTAINSTIRDINRQSTMFLYATTDPNPADIYAPFVTAETLTAGPPHIIELTFNEVMDKISVETSFYQMTGQWPGSFVFNYVVDANLQADGMTVHLELFADPTGTGEYIVVPTTVRDINGNPIAAEYRGLQH